MGIELPGRHGRATRWVVLILAAALLAAVAGETWALKPGFARYTDPARRFSLDYPASMKVDASKPEEVRIYHPKASLRINIFLEKITSKKVQDARLLLEVFKKKMKEEMKDFSILEEGKLAGRIRLSAGDRPHRAEHARGGFVHAQP